MPGRRVASGLVFAVAAAGMFLAAVDQTLVATALSTIIGDFRAPIEWGSWTITVLPGRWVLERSGWKCLNSMIRV